jgi:hypothetical protein
MSPPLEFRLPWYSSKLVGIEYGPTGANDGDDIFMSNITGQQVVDALIKAHAQYGVVVMKDQHFAYYNSQVARKAPNLGECDLLREVTDAARPFGIDIVAYLQVQYDSSTWLAHPEWRMKDPEGNDIQDRLCYNSGYVTYVLACLEEMLPYDIVGFHIDMLDFGFGPPYGCWCPTCRALYQNTFGVPMPAGVTWDDAWDKMLQFRALSNTRFCQWIESFVKTHRPNLSVDFNYHGSPPFSWEVGECPVQHAQNGDLVTAEGLPWIFGNYNASLLPLFLAGARPGTRSQCVGSRSIHSYHDHSVRPVADLRWEVMTYLSHGAQVTIVDKAKYDGSLDPLVYSRLGQVFAEAQDKVDYLGYPAQPEVGLYYSVRSRDWYGREQPTRYWASFAGAHKALVQAHIPLGVLFDESISVDRLRQFPVVYVPNAPVLTAQEVQLFTDYVTAGGNLLLTGLTGMADLYGRLQAENILSSLIGANLQKVLTEREDNYVRLPGILKRGEGAFLLEDVPADWPLLTWGAVSRYQPTTARAYGELLSAQRPKGDTPNTGAQLMSPGSVLGPAVLVNQVGRGRVVCLPCQPDAAIAGDYRAPEHRNLIRNLIRFLNPDPPIIIRAPLNVEAVVTYDAGHERMIVHLIGFNAPPTSATGNFTTGRRVLPPVMEETLTYTASLFVREPFRRAYTVGHDSLLTTANNEIEITTSQVHETVVIEFRTIFPHASIHDWDQEVR